MNKFLRRLRACACAAQGPPSILAKLTKIANVRAPTAPRHRAGILSGRAGRIVWKVFMIIGPKRPRRELTFARLSAIENKCKCFLRSRRRKRAVQVGFMVERREFLKLVLCGIAAPLGAGAGGIAGTPSAAARDSSAGTAPKLCLGGPCPIRSQHGHRGRQNLCRSGLSSRSSADIPGVFRDLSYEQYATIRQRPGTAIWAAENTGFSIAPLHRGFIFSSPDGNQSRLRRQVLAASFMIRPCLTSAGSPSPATLATSVFPASGFSRKARADFPNSPFSRGQAFFAPWRRVKPSAPWRGRCRSRPPIRAARNFRHSAPSGSSVRRSPRARSSFTH